MKTAIIIGHCVSAPGARNERYDVTEYEFNEMLAEHVHELIPNSIIMRRRNGYARLPHEVNAIGAGVAMSLHCNAFNTRTSGTEMLYWHTSPNGKALAESLQREVVGVLGLNDRGAKPVTAVNRGANLLRYTSMPCVICEPFFIDCDTDFELARDNIVPLAEAISRGVLSTPIR